MKYRRLHLDELEELQENFVQFLATNGIDAPTWEDIKVSNETRAYELIDEYSDYVFGHTLSKVEFLLLKSPKEIQELKFEEGGIKMRGIKIQGESDVDLSSAATAEEMFAKMNETKSQLQLISGNKKYTEGKEPEAFKFMEKGYLISAGDLYELFGQLKGEE